MNFRSGSKSGIVSSGSRKVTWGHDRSHEGRDRSQRGQGNTVKDHVTGHERSRGGDDGSHGISKVYYESAPYGVDSTGHVRSWTGSSTCESRVSHVVCTRRTSKAQARTHTHTRARTPAYTYRS